MQGWTFNPPPGWPPAPPQFAPGPDWRPDPAWPAPPEGWVFWIRERSGTTRRQRPGIESIRAQAQEARGLIAKTRSDVRETWSELKTGLQNLKPPSPPVTPTGIGSAAVAGSREAVTRPLPLMPPQTNPPRTPAPRRAPSGKWHRPAGPLSLFAPAYVTRRGGREPLARDMLFAAVDVETTGLKPGTDRVCEIAIVRFRGDGEIESEYATVINPQRRLAATQYHGLTDLDVAEAPTFAQVASDVARYLSGAVVVAHNLAFEDGFLAAEFRRAGRRPPHWPGLCTMVNARAHLDGPSYKLASLYKTLTGEWLQDQHLALPDARASAKVLCRMIATAPGPLRYFGPEPSPSPTRPPASRIAARSGTGGTTGELLAAMSRRLPRTDGSHPADPAKSNEYSRMLIGLLEGRRITRANAEDLEGAAREAGLDQAGVQRLNMTAWDHVLQAAGDPAELDQRRLQSLANAASSLGLTNQAQRFTQLAGASPSLAGPLKGWRIGSIPGSEDAEKVMQFAAANGAARAQRLTKTVRMVIADDPKGQGQQLDLARSLGLRILTPSKADRELRAAVDAAHASEQALLAQREQWERDATTRRQAEESYWNHRWRPREADPSWGWDANRKGVKLG